MSKFKTIAFPTGGVVPADQARKKSEQRPGPHVPVDVLTEYADYLVGDRLAYEWSKETAVPLPTEASGDALLAATRTDAKRIVDEARAEGSRILDEAEAKKKQLLDEAAVQAEEIRAAAQRDAAELISEEGAEEKQDNADGGKTGSSTGGGN